MKQRESRYFIDIKHTIIERNKTSKKQAFVDFIFNSILSLGEKCVLSDAEKKNLSFYVQDYVGFIVQKKILLQKDLKSILFDALICLKATVPGLPDISNLKKHETKEYEAAIEKNLSHLNIYSVKSQAKEEIDSLFQCPYEFMFYCFSKYPYKEEVLRNKLAPELPDIIQVLTFHTFSSMGNRDFIVTAEPRAGGYHKMNLIYFSTEDIPIFRKLTFEHEMSGFNVAAEIVTLLQMEDTIAAIKAAETRPKGQGKTIKVGYIFRKKKIHQLASRKLLSSRYPLEMIPIDLRMPVTRNIDCFLHKIPDQMYGADEPFRDLKIHNFNQMVKENKILLFDSVNKLDTLFDRQVCQDFISDVFKSAEFLDKVKELRQGKDGGMNFDVPKMCNVDPNEVKPEEIESVVKREGMKYPIVVKTQTSCGDKNSHMMALATNLEGLIEIEKAPLYRQYTHVLQEYIEHDERIYKVYVIGKTLYIQQKQSLPNLLDKNLETSHFFFDSQLSFNDNKQFKELSKGFEPLEIDEDVVLWLSQHFNEKLNLTMVGYDLIRETKTGTYYLIDINYFPGYKGMKNLTSVLDNHFLELYKKYQEKKGTKV